MIEYLGAMADYNGQTFPDQPYSVGSDRLNEIYDKAEADRTQAEQKLLDIVNQFKMANLNMMPTGHFIEDHTVEGHLPIPRQGRQARRCGPHYLLVQAQGHRTYRAVYGDLSIRDVAPDGSAPARRAIAVIRLQPDVEPHNRNFNVVFSRYHADDIPGPVTAFLLVLVEQNGSSGCYTGEDRLFSMKGPLR